MLQMTLHLTRSSRLWIFQQLGFEVFQVFSIGQSLMVWDEMWPLCYGVVVPGLKIDQCYRNFIIVQNFIKICTYLVFLVSIKYKNISELKNTNFLY
jgi:hypothetical protein